MKKYIAITLAALLVVAPVVKPAYASFTESTNPIIVEAGEEEVLFDGDADEQDNDGTEEEIVDNEVIDEETISLEGLPYGLAKRDSLPPGLAKMETLPPGLQKKLTNQDEPEEIIGDNEDEENITENEESTEADDSQTTESTKKGLGNTKNKGR